MAEFFFESGPATAGEMEILLDLLERMAPNMVRSTIGALVTVESDTAAELLKELATSQGRTFRQISEPDEQPIEERIAQVIDAWKPGDIAVVRDDSVVVDLITQPEAEPEPAETAVQQRSPNGKAICEGCGEEFSPRRKDMRFCQKTECQAEMKRGYHRNYASRAREKREAARADQEDLPRRKHPGGRPRKSIPSSPATARGNV